MKKFLVFSILILVCSLIWAQSGQAPLSKGEKQLNFGLGFSSYGLPTYIGVDFAVHHDVTVGPVVKLVIDDNIGFGALGRVDYHWNRLLDIPSNWDFYSGASVGFISGDNVDLDLGLQAGGRWYWSEQWRLNLEIGGGTGYSDAIGLSYKF